MPTMDNFHKKLFEPSKDQDPYLDILVALARASHAQMKELASDLGWQDWLETTRESAKA